MRKYVIVILILVTLLLQISFTAQAFDNDLEFLKKLVLISSGTKNFQGVNQVQKLIEKELKSLGFKTILKENPSITKQSGKLLLGTLKGKSDKFITFVMHADTVFEAGNGFSGFKISKDQKTVSGPGVIDDKGGIVIALKGIKQFLKSHSQPKYSLRVLVSPVEEIGASGFYDDYRKFSKDSIMLLGFEPALSDGSIIESRRGNRWYHIKIEGKEAHAGRAHKQGVNACYELAMKIDKLQKLTDYSQDVTVSIGHIEGGKDKFNIVCGFAEAKIDVRASRFTDFDNVHKKIDTILKSPIVKSHDGSAITKTKYKIADDCPPFSVTGVSKPWLERYLVILKSIEGKDIQSKKSGGAADSNYMSRKGLIIIDGLGATGDGLHTKNETLRISSLKTRSNALAQFLVFVNGSKF